MGKYIMNFTKLTLLLALFVTVNMFTALQSRAGDYVLIVSARNDFSAEKASMINEIKRLYLKEKKKWSNGIDGKPLSAKDGTDEQKAFLTTILGMDSASLAQHWIKAKQKSGDTPPRSVGSARSIIKLVARGEGSFGYVSKANTANLNAKVKILFEF